jgi:nucleoside-diphosphate-sugar epimerase
VSLKGRTKFTIAGNHPLLGLVRNHFISRGLALVPWDEDPDFCLIGAEISGEVNPPLAQLELQKMQVSDKPVLLLSTTDPVLAEEDVREAAFLGINPSASATLRSTCIYAIAAEHLFWNREGFTTIVRPFNVYGPDITWGLIHETVISSKRNEPLTNPRRLGASTSFIHQDDFLKAVDLLLAKRAHGVFNVGSGEAVTYINLLRNIWKFVNGADTEPEILQPYTEVFAEWEVPRIIKLHKAIGWAPKTSLRSGLFKMVQE